MIRANSNGIGLALGGGGARGLAHVGVLEVLEREDVPIACIAGTSMGGLIGAAWASGVDASALSAELCRIGQWDRIFRLADLDLPTAGIMSGRRLRRYLEEKLGAALRFDELHVPLALMAVDMLTGRKVALKDGSVLDAMRATMSIPGLFAPVEIDGMRLCDGGILDNVPAEAARELGATAVIAVDVMPSFAGNEPGETPAVKPVELPYLPRVVTDLVRAENIMMSAITEVELAGSRPELLLRPELPEDISAMAGFHRGAELVEAGRRAAEAEVERIRALTGRG